MIIMKFMMLLAAGLWIMLMVGVGLLVFGLIRRSRGACRLAEPRTANGAGDDPLAVLNVRYARGEISREDFEQMRNDILGRGGDPQ